MHQQHLELCSANVWEEKRQVERQVFDEVDMDAFTTERIIGVESGDDILLETRCGERSFSIPREVVPDLIEFFRSVIGADRRRAFRVPVTEQQFTIEIRSNAGNFCVTPKDISSIGIGAGLDEQSLKIAEGDQVTVLLSGADWDIELAGVIRSVTESFVGIEFPSCLRDEEPDPPDEFRKIVAALQMDYIRALRQ